MPGHRLGVVALLNANNGAVAQLGMTKIATGVTSLLLDLPSPNPRLSFRAFYLLVGLFMLVGSFWQLWSLARLLRARRSPAYLGRVLALIRDIAVPLAVLGSVPRWFDAPWALLRLYVLDLSSWLLAMGWLSFVRGTIRGIQIFLGDKRY